MAIVTVTFGWDDRFGECVECGLPAAFEADVYCRKGRLPWVLLCAVCAANAAVDGCTIRRPALPNPFDPTDYSVCSQSPDGKHDPKQGYDPNMPSGYCTVECRRCGITTGLPIPDAADIDWG